MTTEPKFKIESEYDELHLSGINGRIFVLPTAAWATLRSRLLGTFKEGAIPFMFQIGYAVGQSFAEQLAQLRTGPVPPTEVLPEIARSSGWGPISIEGDVEHGSNLVLTAENCPFCHNEERADSPICEFLVGFVNSTVDNLYGKPHSAVENKCRRVGGSVCEIVVTETPGEVDRQHHWGTYVLFPWLRPKK